MVEKINFHDCKIKFYMVTELKFFEVTKFKVLSCPFLMGNKLKIPNSIKMERLSLKC